MAVGLHTLTIDAMQAAALRILSNGGPSPLVASVLTIAYPRYTDKQLVRILRMLANELDKEDDVD